MLTAESVFAAQDELGESPVWHPEEQALYWVDIQGKKIHRLASEHSEIALDQIVAAIALRKGGGLIAALRKSIAFIDFNRGRYEALCSVENDLEGNRFNDGKCDKQGRFWAGTMHARHLDQPLGTLYRLDRDLSIHPICFDVICSNGLGWSPDGKVFYFTESFRHAIFAFDFHAEAGTVGKRCLFANVDSKSGGVPDGLTVDAEGCVWSAQYGLGQVVRYTPQGKVDRIIKVPVPRVTSCAFGGANYDTLFITTAREAMDREALRKWPLSGNLFAATPGVRGLAEAPFAS